MAELAHSGTQTSVEQGKGRLNTLRRRRRLPILGTLSHTTASFRQVLHYISNISPLNGTSYAPSQLRIEIGSQALTLQTVQVTHK